VLVAVAVAVAVTVLVVVTVAVDVTVLVSVLVSVTRVVVCVSVPVATWVSVVVTVGIEHVPPTLLVVLMLISPLRQVVWLLFEPQPITMKKIVEKRASVLIVFVIFLTPFQEVVQL
jgi:hypothetical protein